MEECVTLAKELFTLAKPYLIVRRNLEHTRISFDYALMLQEKLGGNKRIIISAIILHDIGWSAIHEKLHLQAFGPKKNDLRINRIHEVEGARMAGLLLKKLSFNGIERKEICRIIKSHDSGENPLNLEEKIVKDSDKLFRFSPKGFYIDVGRFALDPRVYMDKLYILKEQWFFTDYGKSIAAEELRRIKDAFFLKG